MAHWNPYYNGPNQNNTFYEDQNPHVYNSLPYGAPYQQYDSYYLQNATNYSPNAPATIRTAREIEAEQLLYSRNQQSVHSVSKSKTEKSNSQSEGSSSRSVLNSNLTATAAEFRPSTSNNSNVEVKSQTFSNNNFKDLEPGNFTSRGFGDTKDKRKKENEPRSSKSNDTTDIPPNSKGNFMKFSNKKSYNRYDNPQSSTGDRYNRPKDKDKYRSNRSSRDELEPKDNNSTQISSGSGRFPHATNYQRDNYYSSKNNKYTKNGENSYSRNNQESNDR